MLSNKIQRRIDSRLAKVVDGNPKFLEYFLDEDGKYLEEKLDPAYRVWRKVVDVQGRLERNFGQIVSVNTSLQSARANRTRLIELLGVDGYNANVEMFTVKKQGYEWDRDDLYNEAVKALKDYDWYYSHDGERTAYEWDWSFLESVSLDPNAPQWQFDA